LICELGAQCDVIVSTSARDDDGGGYDTGGCGMRAFGSCYSFGSLSLATSRFAYRVLGANVCIFHGPQEPYMCIYTFMFITWYYFIRAHDMDCVSFM